MAKVRGPAEALAAIEPLENDPKLRDYYLLLAVRGHLLLELGRQTEAAACFRAALDCTVLGARAAVLEAETRGLRPVGLRPPAGTRWVYN